MKKRGIPRDAITYRNAIMVCRDDVNAALRMLRTSLSDAACFERKSFSKPMRLAADDVVIFNAALSACAIHGDLPTVSLIFKMMKDQGVKPNSVSVRHLISALGASGHCDNILALLESLRGDTYSNRVIREKHGIDLFGSGIGDSLPWIEERHYSSAITACLKQRNVDLAERILTAMKENSLSPSHYSLQEIAFAYCQMAMVSAGKEFKVARKQRKTYKKKSSKLELEQTVSSARAREALQVLKTLKEPPARLMSAIAVACGASGLWNEGRTVLCSMHRAVLREEREKMSKASLVTWNKEYVLGEVPRLHRSMLKLAARRGNVTAALWFADDIQDLASRLVATAKSKKELKQHVTVPTISSYLSAESSSDEYSSLAFEVDTNAIAGLSKHALSSHSVGMKGEDWKLLMIAASKSFHWRVCLGTLRFL